MLGMTSRKLVWLILLAAAIFGAASLLGWYVKRGAIVARQRELIQRLDELGAHWYYEFQLASEDSSEILDEQDALDRRHRLAAWFGKDWFHDVFYVSFAAFDRFQKDGAIAADRSEIDDSVVAQLYEMPGLSWVALSGTAVSDRGVIGLAESLPLERLWLSQTSVGDSAMAALGRCSTVTHLALDATPISDRGIQSIVGLPRLQFLSLGGPLLTREGLAQLAQARQLKQLYLDGLPVDDSLLGQIATLERLEVLSIRGTPTSDLGMKHLSRLEQLRELRLDGTPIGDGGLEASRHWPELQHLSVSGTRLSDRGLAELTGCKALQTIELAGTQCTLGGVVDLLVRQQGRTLEEAFQVAFGAKMDDSGALLSVNLSAIRITNEDIAYLQPLRELQWLEVPNNLLTDQGAMEIADLQLPELNMLRLDNSQITDVGLQTLLHLPNLKNLHLRNTRVSDEAIRVAHDNFPSLRIYKSELLPGGKP